MVYQQDSEILLPGGLRQNFLEELHLYGTDAAHSQMRRTGLRCAHTNYGDTAPDTQAGKDAVHIFDVVAIIPRGI